MTDIDLVAAIQPQIDGEQVIVDLLRDAGLPVDSARRLAQGVISRLAFHDPPILLCFPDQIKDHS